MWPWKGELLAYAAVTKSPRKPMKLFMKAVGRGEESECLVFHRIAVATDVQGQGVAQTFLERLD